MLNLCLFIVPAAKEKTATEKLTENRRSEFN